MVLVLTMTATLQPPPLRTRGSSMPSRRATASQVAIEEMVAALRTIPHGGLDDGARRFPLPPPVRATISPMVVTLRWTAVVAGAVFGVEDAHEVPLQLVVTLGVCLALTVWRTCLPLTLASRRHADRTVALTDAVLAAAAVGLAGTAGVPFVPVVVVTVAVAAFGWGYGAGGSAAVAAAAGLLAGWLGSADGVGGFHLPDVLVLAGLLVVAATAPARVRLTLLDAERRRLAAAGRNDALTQTNDLLTMLSSVARTLPSPLSLRDALDTTHDELSRTFSPSVVCLLERDESNDEWVPKLAEGCILRPTCATDDLPDPLRRCLDMDGPLLVRTIGDDGPGISVGSRSGMYVRLRIRDRVVGLLGIEHRSPEQFGGRHAQAFAEMSGATALTLDNARRFGRLRSLGAEEERSRITRDLHDRLGQWLTYISFELERIISSAGPAAPELGHLYTDVQSALDELRETLRQLQSGVAEGRPLARVGADIVERFRERTDLTVSWDVLDPTTHLPVPVENELLRILQESLSNIERHAAASHVDITWDVLDGVGVLIIRDDGRGFASDQGVRDRAYGLVGMRERADVIGARLTIDSTPGKGTTIRVVAGATTEIQEI